MTGEYAAKLKKERAGLDKRAAELLTIAGRMMKADNGTLFPMDLFAMGAMKRVQSTIAGFRALLDAENLVCCRAILRLQIDTAVRFAAAFLVPRPHDFAIEVMRGTPIRDMKDRDGRKLTDRHLVTVLSEEYEWLPRVYDTTSGYIHLSSHHIFSSLNNPREVEGTGEFDIELSEKDSKYPPFSWYEVVACFNEATDIFLRYLAGWTLTKESPPASSSSGTRGAGA